MPRGAEDQRLLEHLTALGFKQPVKVARTVQLWMAGEYRVFRNEATRSAFNEFVPALIDGLARCRGAGPCGRRYSTISCRRCSGAGG